MSNQDGGRIYFGSLENAERNRLLEESKSDTMSIASHTTRATATAERKLRPTGRVESLEFSKETQEAKKRHEEKVRRYELEKAAKNIVVPTNENDVKQRLRELKQPVTYFGETPMDRRERYSIPFLETKSNVLRLKKLLAKILMEKGELPTFQKTQGFLKEEENEEFIYEGTKELKQARQEITQFSLKQAAIRLENAKIRKETVDPIEEEELIDKELTQIPEFEISMVQFADPSCVSKGAFSPDGKYFATAGWSGLCKIWSIPDCSLKTTLLGHINRAIDIQFHPWYGSNNQVAACLATSGADNTVRVWPLDETDEYQKSTVFKGHEDRVNKVRFHPDGKHLISTSHDKTWKLWDIETKKDLLTQMGHTKPVYACSIQQDGSLVYTGDLGGYGMLWDIRIGKGILPLLGHVKQIISSDFHLNGYHLVTGSDDNTVRFWDIRRKNCFNTLPAHNKLISDVKFQPQKSRFLVTASYDKTCKVWSAKDWSLVRTLKAMDSKVTSISITEDMSYMATTTLDRKWMLWSKTKKSSNNGVILPE